MKAVTSTNNVTKTDLGELSDEDKNEDSDDEGNAALPEEWDAEYAGYNSGDQSEQEDLIEDLTIPHHTVVLDATRFSMMLYHTVEYLSNFT